MQYDMEELLEQANEVQESLSRSYAVPDEIDEADLEAGVPFSCTESANLWLKGLEHRVGRAWDGGGGRRIVSCGSQQGARFYRRSSHRRSTGSPLVILFY